MIRNFILTILLILIQNIGNAQHDTTILIGTVPVDFRFPATVSCGTILVLPGWNFSKTNVCERSEFCSSAKERGYALVLPEMLKSVYSSELYKETRADWRRYPTLRWITDTLIPYCRLHFGLFNRGDKNFLYGISTGARGVALVAENTGDLFMAGAALSGDYDQTAMPDDKLMTGYYGPYQQFSDRWEGKDNPFLHSDRLKIPLFLAHGKKDAVVPCSQTTAFYNKIAAENPVRGQILQLSDTCGHNYAFWNSCTRQVLNFFRKSGKRSRPE
ncbi:MAG: prolyl oligopeptidase family serine peptidase [Bacteroidetes bacterium]|nr:prolyl oligopeptidase family serine peptidase [Bacteroidota bacterium]